MKKFLLLLGLLFTFGLQAQEYDFIPEGLTLLPVEEVYKKPPPQELDLVFYENGEKATLQEAFGLFMKGKHIPHMFVDSEGNYKALVIFSSETKIDYDNIPENLVSYGYSIGNPNSDKVIIYCQGGPSTQLVRSTLIDIFDGKVDMNDVFIIHLHQAQTLKPELFKNEEISFDKAKQFGQYTTKMLADIISYFKSEDKEVYVFGFSFGAFVGADLIAEYGNVADGYLLMGGRLDMTEEVWKAWSDGIEAKRNNDAVGVTLGKKASDVNLVNTRKIGASFGYKRYTELLEPYDLSNLIYIYGEKDLQVGTLTSDEVEFLNSKNAKVISNKKGHSDIYLGNLQEGFDLLLNDN